MEDKKKYLKYKKKYLELKKQIGGTKPFKLLAKGYRLHFVPEFRTTHLGNGIHWTTDIIKFVTNEDPDTKRKFTGYETKNTIYVHEGLAYVAIECDCKMRNHLNYE